MLPGIPEQSSKVPVCMTKVVPETLLVSECVTFTGISEQSAKVPVSISKVVPVTPLVSESVMLPGIPEQSPVSHVVPVQPRKVVCGAKSQFNLEGGQNACMGMATAFLFEAERGHVSTSEHINNILCSGLSQYMRVTEGENMHGQMIRFSNIVKYPFGSVPFTFTGICGRLCYGAKETESIDALIREIDNYISDTGKILIIINNVTSALIKKNNIYMFFDSHKNNKKGRASSRGHAVLVVMNNISQCQEYLRERHSGYFPVKFSAYRKLSKKIVSLGY